MEYDARTTNQFAEVNETVAAELARFVQIAGHAQNKRALATVQRRLLAAITGALAPPREPGQPLARNEPASPLRTGANSAAGQIAPSPLEREHAAGGGVPRDDVETRPSRQSQAGGGEDGAGEGVANQTLTSGSSTTDGQGGRGGTQSQSQGSFQAPGSGASPELSQLSQGSRRVGTGTGGCAAGWADVATHSLLSPGPASSSRGPGSVNGCRPVQECPDGATHDSVVPAGAAAPVQSGPGAHSESPRRTKQGRPLDVSAANKTGWGNGPAGSQERESKRAKVRRVWAAPLSASVQIRRDAAVPHCQKPEVVGLICEYPLFKPFASFVQMWGMRCRSDPESARARRRRQECSGVASVGEERWVGMEMHVKPPPRRQRALPGGPVTMRSLLQPRRRA